MPQRLEEQAVMHAAGSYGRTAVAALPQVIASVDPKPAELLLRAVAAVAILREYGTYAALKMLQWSLRGDHRQPSEQ
jgi:hypothetical protein